MYKANLPISKFTLADSKPEDFVSNNFRLYELAASDTAARRGINNWFRADSQLQSSIYLCRKVLQPIRTALGPFSPNSVYRSQALERAIKNKPAEWKSRSQHTLGQAADIEMPGMTNLELARWVDSSIPQFDQLILEYYIPGKPSSGWVHVSLRQSGNRMEVLTFDGKNHLRGIVA